MDFKFIEYRKRKDKIGELILNRPEKLNAINDEMRREMIAALDDAERDDDINVLILKGNGRSFSSGHDMSRVGTYYGFKVEKEEKENRRPSQRVRLKRDREILTRPYLDRFLFSWIPIITQVHGHCIGGAMMLQSACDITIAADDAQLGYPEQRLGFAGSPMDLGLLTMTVGPKRAQEMVLTGKVVSGKEAAEMGLISRSVPAERLEEEVEICAQTIARMPRDGIVIGRATKELVYTALGLASDKTIGYVTHTLFTNLRWEEDEYNFFKGRRNKGTHAAMHEREEFFEKAKQDVQSKRSKS
jgi:enoyl-CoA hydratase